MVPLPVTMRQILRDEVTQVSLSPAGTSTVKKSAPAMAPLNLNEGMPACTTPAFWRGFEPMGQQDVLDSIARLRDPDCREPAQLQQLGGTNAAACRASRPYQAFEAQPGPWPWHLRLVGDVGHRSIECAFCQVARAALDSRPAGIRSAPAGDG